MTAAPNPAAEGLAELLRAKREREGLSTREVEAATGVSFSTVARIERGGGFTVGVERKLRAWLNGEGPPVRLPPMSLRDWFAGQAIVGILANSENVAAGTEPTNSALSGPGFPDWLSLTAYRVADAMLAERAKGPTDDR